MKTTRNISSVVSVGAILAIALLAGCATGPTVKSHPDSAVVYASYKTFAMMRPSGTPATANAAVTPSIIRVMRAETETAFVAKGLSKAPESSADLLVLVHGGVDEKLDVSSLGYGRFHRWLYDVQEYQEGTILIDVFDAQTKELVWRGTAVGEIGDAPKPQRVKTTIDAIIARYPN